MSAGHAAASHTLALAVRGIGLLGPGLDDWLSAQAALRTPATHYVRRATVVPAPARLPANERRRAGTVIKAALAVADQAVAMAQADPARLATVFTSSTGDPATCHALCEALATPERLVSPTRFTNSVHNAPAGYWHIAAQSRRASTSIAAFDASFGAGLLEAAVQCCVSGDEVLLVACDVPYPAPLHAVRPLADGMAVALVLAPLRPSGAPGAPGASAGLAAAAAAPPREGGLEMHLRLLHEGVAPTACTSPALEELRGQIPAARALTLLMALASLSAADAPAGLGAPIHLDVAEGCSAAVQVQRSAGASA